MKKKLLCGLFIVTALLATDVALQAQDQDRQRTQDRDRTHVEDQGQAYGWQMMSEQERLEYRERMRTMHTEQERERYRLEHRSLMQERARQRGVGMPAAPGGKGKQPMQQHPGGGGRK